MNVEVEQGVPWLCGTQLVGMSESPLHPKQLRPPCLQQQWIPLFLLAAPGDGPEVGYPGCGSVGCTARSSMSQSKSGNRRWRRTDTHLDKLMYLYSIA